MNLNESGPYEQLLGEEEEETDTIDMLEDLSGGGEISEVAVGQETHTMEMLELA